MNITTETKCPECGLPLTGTGYDDQSYTLDCSDQTCGFSVHIADDEDETSRLAEQLAHNNRAARNRAAALAQENGGAMKGAR